MYAVVLGIGPNDGWQSKKICTKLCVLTGKIFFRPMQYSSYTGPIDLWKPKEFGIDCMSRGQMLYNERYESAALYGL